MGGRLLLLLNWAVGFGVDAQTRPGVNMDRVPCSKGVLVFVILCLGLGMFLREMYWDAELNAYSAENFALERINMFEEERNNRGCDCNGSIGCSSQSRECAMNTNRLNSSLRECTTLLNRAYASVAIGSAWGASWESNKTGGFWLSTRSLSSNFLFPSQFLLSWQPHRSY